MKLIVSACIVLKFLSSSTSSSFSIRLHLLPLLFRLFLFHLYHRHYLILLHLHHRHFHHLLHLHHLLHHLHLHLLNLFHLLHLLRLCERILVYRWHARYLNTNYETVFATLLGAVYARLNFKKFIKKNKLTGMNK